MSKYAYVENGEVVGEYNALPKSWKNISGLNLLEGDIETLIQHGWYRISYAPISHDPNVSYVSGYTYTVLSDQVIKDDVITNYTQEEIEQLRDTFFKKLRKLRDQKLTECDWTMMTDVRAQQTAEWITAWESYRQELRDLPEAYVDTTDFDISKVSWPPSPNTQSLEEI